MSTVPHVYLIHEHAPVRESLQSLIRGAGWVSETFGDARELLDKPPAGVPSCLIVATPIPGLAFAAVPQLMAGDPNRSIIFLADNGRTLVTVRATRTGAVEYVARPYGDEAVIEAVREGIEQSRSALQALERTRTTRESYDSLTTREREVMGLVVLGLLNKQVAFELGIAEQTVKAHRGSVMRKMMAASFADLVDMARELDIARGSPRFTREQRPPTRPQAWARAPLP